MWVPMTPIAEATVLSVLRPHAGPGARGRLAAIGPSAGPGDGCAFDVGAEAEWPQPMTIRAAAAARTAVIAERMARDAIGIACGGALNRRTSQPLRTAQRRAASARRARPTAAHIRSP